MRKKAYGRWTNVFNDFTSFLSFNLVLHVRAISEPCVLSFGDVRTDFDDSVSSLRMGLPLVKRSVGRGIFRFFKRNIQSENSSTALQSYYK